MIVSFVNDIIDLYQHVFFYLDAIALFFQAELICM